METRLRRIESAENGKTARDVGGETGASTLNSAPAAPFLRQPTTNFAHGASFHHCTAVVRQLDSLDFCLPRRLLVECGGAIEVLGTGTVTIVDGRAVISNVSDLPNHHCPEMIDVRLHLLPSGSRYRAAGALDGTQASPDAIDEFIRIITKIA